MSGLTKRIKRWWHSRTMWLNIGSLAALAPLATTALGYVDVIGLSEQAAGQAGMFLSMFAALANMYLRKNSPVAIGEEVE